MHKNKRLYDALLYMARVFIILACISDIYL